ncbi:MAG: hypothetical protein HOC23_05045 [Halieaceae bacterium]|jgi:hypothetical protein|nr:hypothetical protein [Halieaceae bacterium]
MAAKLLKFGVPILFLALVVFVIAAPIGPVPGFFIGGTAADAPDAWGDTQSIHEIKLEINTGILPRVVTIWVVQHDGALYVVGDGTSGWVTMLDQGGPVRMRMGDKTYSLKASRVRRNLVPILEAYQGKYQADYPEIISSFPPVEEAIKSAGIFRLGLAP